MASLLKALIENTYLDDARYDIAVRLPENFSTGDNELNAGLVIRDAEGISDLLIKNGRMTTPELTLTCHATPKTDYLLRKLYEKTVLPGCICMDYPITVGIKIQDGATYSFPYYLKEYEAASAVDYSRVELKTVKLTLRMI